MKFNVNFALRVAAAVVISAAASHAFAAGGLFDGGLFKGFSKSAPAASDGFFAGEALTFGDMGSVSFDGYEASGVNMAYGECAECAGSAPAAASFEYPVFDGYVGDFGFVDEYGWEPARPAFQPVRTVLNGAGSVLRGVRDFLFGHCNFCQPAYVCDPCWAIDDCCDPCGWDPCAVCDPCAPACNPCEPVCNPCAPACEPCEPACFNTGAVFAPGGCCGNGYMPGQVRPLNKETGRPEGAKGAGAAPARSYEPEEQPAATEQPAVPGVEDDAQPVDEYNSGAPEIAPATEPATTGAGLIKMLVPKDAVVYVNGYRTKQTGEVRTFAAKNLEVGETYAFEIRVVAVRDGRTYEDVQSTTLTAGDTSSLAFNLTLRGNQAYAYNK